MKSNLKKKVFTLRLSTELKKQLTEEAEKLGMTVNGLIIMKILNTSKKEDM